MSTIPEPSADPQFYTGLVQDVTFYWILISLRYAQKYQHEWQVGHLVRIRSPSRPDCSFNIITQMVTAQYLNDPKSRSKQSFYLVSNPHVHNLTGALIQSVQLRRALSSEFVMNERCSNNSSPRSFLLGSVLSLVHTWVIIATHYMIGPSLTFESHEYPG